LALYPVLCWCLCTASLTFKPVFIQIGTAFSRTFAYLLWGTRAKNTASKASFSLEFGEMELVYQFSQNHRENDSFQSVIKAHLREK
jgi:hypothetical protein